MRSLFLPLTIVSSTALAQLTEEQQPESPTPFYLPRALHVGTFVGDAVSPFVRLQWELTIIQERVDSFVLVLEGGGAFGISFPKNAGPDQNKEMTSLRQYSILGGVGYRGTRRSGFHWGAHIVAGPLFFNAKFNGLPSESSSVGVVEGRVQVGWKLGLLVYGVGVGIAQTYQNPARVYSAPYLGGLMLGLFADWR
jgi:hypothetical protein